MSLSIKLADLYSRDFVCLVEAHKALMLKHTPPESSHALLIDGLRAKNIFVWSLFDDDKLVGCGALKLLSSLNGEIKGMHTVQARRRQGLGHLMLSHLLQEARVRELIRLSLETGSQDAFIPARKLYELNGFKYCGPFGEYREDPNSAFMTLEL